MNRTFKIGIFDEEEKFISSIKSLQEKEFKIYDVFTPYPVHEVFHLLKRKSRLPTAAYFFGLFAIIAVLAFLYYTSVIRLANCLWRETLQLIPVIYCCYNCPYNFYSYYSKPCRLFSQVETFSRTGKYNL